ncbi:hypothetical protein SELMODRAFT_420471 [Selaginella moellendorffii]|uniref:Uncharacterized protein n=1 Tax=Selaginella moellendorffii TaxID=88036 RepID=D8SC34_SELML|nr:hypothetical protein SELMODRAFT_420471 [Selaginella moellendorffii]
MLPNARISLPLLLLLLLLEGSQRSPGGGDGGILAAHSLDLWTIRGKLSEVTKTLAAITQLSRNLQQSSTWWQLSNVDWHPEALWRFLLLGPPAAGILPNSSWGPDQELELLRRGGLAATREAAVAEYTTETGRPGTGRIRMTTWVLMYNCITPDCDIVAPVILLQGAGGDGQSPTKLNYGTLWQQLFFAVSSSVAPVLLSSSTSDIINRTRLVATNRSNLQLRVVREGLEQCNEGIAIGRSPLDAAYKVPPGICYELVQSLKEGLNQTRMLVVLQNQPHEITWPYTRRPLHECSTAPVLTKNLEEFRGCAFSATERRYYCTNFTMKDYADTPCRGNKIAIALSNFQLAYSYLHGRTSTKNLTDSFELVNDTAPGAPCNTSGRTKAAIYSVHHNGFDLSNSIWEDTSGSRTEELELGRPDGSFCFYGLGSDVAEKSLSYLRRCNITIALNTSVPRCDITALDIDLLNVMFNDTVTAYADEHNTAFNMDRGPSTDLFTAWAALVTAAVSVVTATVPCTNLELEYLARFVYPKKHENLKVLKFSGLAAMNVAFGMILYAPIFAMILSESKRSESYHTWSLFTNDVKRLHRRGRVHLQVPDTVDLRRRLRYLVPSHRDHHAPPLLQGVLPPEAAAGRASHDVWR